MKKIILTITSALMLFSGASFASTYSKYEKSSVKWNSSKFMDALKQDGVKMDAIQRALTECLRENLFCAYQNTSFKKSNHHLEGRYYTEATAIVEAIDYFNLRNGAGYSKEYRKVVEHKEEWKPLHSLGVQFRALMRAFGECRNFNDLCVIAGTTEDYARSNSRSSEIGGSATVVGYNLKRRRRD